MENSVHIILQGKGGVGKSYIASLIAQYIISKEKNLLAFDIDQINATFSKYLALNVNTVSVIDDDLSINPIHFDQLMMDVIQSTSPVVIDTGANTFNALLSYIVQNDMLAFLHNQGKNVIIHTVIAGGDMLDDTANGFYSIVSELKAPIVLWNNEHFGSTSKGQGHITDLALVDQHKEFIIGCINLPALNPQTFGVNIRRMKELRLTFNEGVSSNQFNIIEKQRLTMVQRGVFDQLNEIEWP